MTYPIVHQRPLDPTRKRGWLRGRARDAAELPQPSAHHVLVFRVNGNYVVDNAERALNAEEVVDASHVSVVDMTRDAEIMVQLSIPSADAAEFTIQVTFSCTVTNAVVVVREGIVDAKAILRAYLKSHSRIFELGLGYRLEQVNDVRRDVNAQVKAYAALKPPITPGLEIQYRSVEVHTPDGLAEFERKRRQQEADRRLEAERLNYDQALELNKEEHTRLLSTKALRHELDQEADRKDFDRFQRREDRKELEELVAAISNDPQRVLMLAMEQGRLDPVELADRMAAEAQRLADDKRQDQLAELEHNRQLERLALEQGLEDNRWRRDVEHQRRLWDREDEGFARDEARHQRQIKLEVIRELGKHGYLDMTNVDPNRLMDELTARQETPELGAGDDAVPALSGARTDESDEDDTDPGVREEDAR